MTTGEVPPNENKPWFSLIRGWHYIILSVHWKRKSELITVGDRKTIKLQLVFFFFLMFVFRWCPIWTYKLCSHQLRQQKAVWDGPMISLIYLLSLNNQFGISLAEVPLHLSSSNMCLGWSWSLLMGFQGEPVGCVAWNRTPEWKGWNQYRAPEQVTLLPNESYLQHLFWISPVFGSFYSKISRFPKRMAICPPILPTKPPGVPPFSMGHFHRSDPKKEGRPVTHGPEPFLSTLPGRLRRWVHLPRVFIDGDVGNVHSGHLTVRHGKSPCYE